MGSQQLPWTEQQDAEILRRRRVSPWWRVFCVVALLLDLMFIASWVTSLRRATVKPNTLFPSANSAIQYSKQRLWRPLHDNAFAGNARPERDTAWRELIEPLAIKITEEEADRLDDPSVALKDGSGYIAEMAVFHELHCIKRLRQHLSLDYYYPNMTEKEMDIETTHVDHCFEYLRKAAICRGDTSLATFFWEDGKPKTRNWSDHVCIDWQQLYDFAYERRIQIDDYDALVGPDGH